MPQEGYKNIVVRSKTWDALLKDKLKAQVKAGRILTWDEYFLGGSYGA